MKTRIRRWRGAKAIVVVAIAAVMLAAFAAPVSASGGYQSFARDTSLGPYYDGVYANFYYNPVNQGGTNCGNPSANNYSDYPVMDQGRMIGPSGYVWIRLRDTCGGFVYWEYGFGEPNGTEHTLVQQLVGFGAGWHSFAFWRPFSIGFGGGNGSNNRFYFSLDNVQQTYGMTWSAQFDNIDVGVESHAPEPATIVGRQTFSGLQYMQASYNQWTDWSGQDARTISTYMCGKWGANTVWYGGTSGVCPF